MHLSQHFTLAEFTVSETAARRGIDNTPPPEVIETLKRTALGLELVRTRLGWNPIVITSGYRSPELNRLVGGQPNSQHLTGHAADFLCPRYGSPTEVATALRDSDVEYDQLILEFASWVHISFTRAPRRQALTIDRNGTRPMFT